MKSNLEILIHYVYIFISFFKGGGVKTNACIKKSKA